MTPEKEHYSVLVLFGHQQDFTSSSLVREVANSLSKFINTGGVRLKCRGRIDDQYLHNVAPRASFYNNKLIDKWNAVLKHGAFKYIELFDDLRLRGQYPRVYASMHNFSSGSSVSASYGGAANGVIVAIQRNFGGALTDSLEHKARELTFLLSGFYGFLEYSVPWNQEMSGGAYLSDQIDMRWHDRTRNDYQNGMYRMNEVIPRLYWGNMIQRQHFTLDDPLLLPSWAVTRLESWGNELFYVRFVRDPQSDAAFRRELEPYFHII